MISVVLVDDHLIVRSGFAQLLNLEEDIDVVGEYGSAQEAYGALIEKDVDVLVVDISMPDETGLSLFERLHKVKPNLKAIVLSIYDSASYVNKALGMGVMGYLSKRCGPQELVTAIRSVANSRRYLCADALFNLSNASQEPSELEPLTKREREVFDLLIQGKDVKEVAFELNVSHKTVHVHRANILAKLEVANNVELIRFALAKGLLPHDNA